MPALRSILGLFLGLLLTLPAAIALAALSGIGHRWVDLLAQFTGPALVMAAALTAAAALVRARAVLIGGAATTLLIVAAGWSQWVPPQGAPGSSAETLTLYSANLHRDNDDVDAIARSIAASDADVVVLVETGYAPARALDRLLVDHPYRAVQGRIHGPQNTALTVIASRWPLRDLDLRIAVLSAAGAVVDTPLGAVTVAGVHMTRPWPYQIQWEQIRQAQGLTDWAATTPGPLIAAGDFNSVSSARIGRQIQADSRLIPVPGWPGTWPSALPAFAGITIDQVYRSPDLAVVGRRLGRPTGSDHRPVVTRFVRAAAPAA